MAARRKPCCHGVSLRLPEDPTRILLADDNELYRGGLRASLDGIAGIEVVAEAEDGFAAVRLAAELQPDAVLMDVVMPNRGGIEATRQIAASHPKVKVIGLSFHSDRAFVSTMLAAGACGYLLKDASLSEVVAALRSVAADGTCPSPEFD